MSGILDAYGRPALSLRKARASGGRYAPGGFQAADWSVNRSLIHYQAGDSSRDITRFTRSEIDRKARYLDKNIGMPRGVRKDFIKYVIGPGIMPFSNTGDPKLDEQYDEWFMEWSKICDIGGRLSFWDYQRAAVSNEFLSGDVFRLLVEKPGGYPQLKLVRSHNCENDGNEAEPERWHDGIYLDRNGAAARYKFRNGSKGHRIMRGSAVVHSMFTEHGDEIRQVSALSGAILNLHDAMDLLAAEKINVKDNQMTSRVIKKEYPGMEDEDEDDDPLGKGTASMADGGASLEAVPLKAIFGPEIMRLNIGEDLKSFKSERPNPTFTGFLDYLGREINAATGWRYEFSWNPQGVNSGTIRQILDSCKRTAQAWQQEEIKHTHRIRNYAIARAIDLGYLPATQFWWRAEYLPGSPDPTIDKGRDGKLDVLLVKNRMQSLKDYFGKQGKHWKLQLNQMKREQEFMDEHGLEFDSAAVDVTSADVNTGSEDDEEDPKNPSNNQ